MTTIGRNRPCPCGSGKKYKLCCGVEELRQRDSSARERLRAPRTERDLRAYLVRELLGFARDNLSEMELAGAWRQFLDPETDLDDVSAEAGRDFADMVDMAFNEWLLHDYVTLDGPTLIDLYVDRHGDIMPERSRAHLERSARTVLSVYEVARVDPGRGLELNDLFRGGTHHVVERSASKRDVLIVRLIELDGQLALSGAILPLPRQEVSDFLERVEEGFETVREERPDASRDDYLKLYGRELLRWVVLWWMEPAPTPELVTFDGEPLVFCRSHYRVRDAAAAREALESHPDLEPQEAPPGEARSRGPRAFVWLGEAPEDGSDAGPAPSIGADDHPIVRGSIELEENELRLETQSEARLTRLRRLIEDAAGGSIEHRADTVEDPLQAIERHSDRPGPAAGSDRVPPEIQQEVMGEVMVRHYRAWLDEEIPALDGHTPRDAVRTEAGRADVLDLIKNIENRVDRARRDGEPTWDPGFLREELGLPDG